jgi:hypothetical protein
MRLHARKKSRLKTLDERSAGVMPACRSCWPPKRIRIGRGWPFVYGSLPFATMVHAWLGAFRTVARAHAPMA